MESTIRQTTDVKHELDMTLTKEDLTPYLDTAYRDAQKNVSMKGFRKGKVPIQMIRKMYGRSIEQDAYDEAIQKQFATYVQEHDLHPIGQPSITKLDRAEDGGITFTIAYEVMPQFELGEYKGISAQRIYHITSQEEVDEELGRIREGQASLEPAESVADENHTAVVDLVRIENGEYLEEGAMRDMPVYLRRDNINRDLKSSLLNTKVGDTFTIDLPTGENEEMNTYEARVKEIKQVVLPELNDELAVKLMGEGSTVEGLTEYVRESINAEFERRYSSMFRDELIGKLVERHHFEVPEVIVNEVLHSFVEDMKKGKNKQLPADFDQAKFFEENRELAIRTARWAFLRDRIIEKEELKPEETDYEGLADIEAQRYGLSYETLLNYFKTSDSIRERILAEKTIQFLEDYAIITEVEDRELMAQQPPAGAPPVPEMPVEQETATSEEAGNEG